MGCTPSQRRDLRTNERKETKVGQLKIIVTGGEFYESAKDFKAIKNPVLYVQVSNQVFSTGSVSNIKEQSPVKKLIISGLTVNTKVMEGMLRLNSMILIRLKSKLTVLSKLIRL